MKIDERDRTAPIEPHPTPKHPLAAEEIAPGQRSGNTLRLFRSALYLVNILLGLAVLLAAYSSVWEYSTGRYLKGFSDAIAPASSPPIEKIGAILNWMARGPARRETGADPAVRDRDPTDTLNYASLLSVCGSATNAFVNLADSAGLTARRLLLLNERHVTKHVVAEVRVNGRWIVVDPVFRLIPRGADGQPLTREELANPAVLAAATHGVPNYLPEYTFDRTAHVRMSRIPVIGVWLGNRVRRLLPQLENSTALSLLLERESLEWLAFFRDSCRVPRGVANRHAMVWREASGRPFGQDSYAVAAGASLLPGHDALRSSFLGPQFVAFRRGLR